MYNAQHLHLRGLKEDFVSTLNCVLAKFGSRYESVKTNLSHFYLCGPLGAQGLSQPSWYLGFFATRWQCPLDLTIRVAGEDHFCGLWESELEFFHFQASQETWFRLAGPLGTPQGGDAGSS